MKRILTVLMIAVLLAAGWTAAAAERTVVTAVAAEVNPDALVSVAADAMITADDGDTVAVTLLVQERYRPDEILNLRIGDAIYTQGREVDIRSISEEYGYLVLNGGEEDEVYLFESVDLYYWIMDVNDNTWTELATVWVPLPEDLVFLDEIDPATGEGLLLPTVHNRAGFLSLLASEDDPGFDLHNVTVVFDDQGELAVIRRYYVPWQ